MKLFQEGDKSKAICSQCRATVATTFARLDVPFSDGKGLARNLLVGVCDHCGQVVSIPAQSVPAVKAARQTATRSIEAQLPAIYVDALDLAAYTVDNSSSTDFRRVLLTYYVHRFAGDEGAVSKLLAAHKKAKRAFPERRGTSRRRISMKVSPNISIEIRGLTAATNLSATEVLKSLVYELHSDVLDTPRPSFIRELKNLAAVYV